MLWWWIRAGGCAMVAACCVPAQPQTNEAVAVLERARTRIAAEIAPGPTYSCTQTMARAFLTREKGTLRGRTCAVTMQLLGEANFRPITIERARLEALIEGSRERFYWPGSASFSEEQSREIQASGLTVGALHVTPFLETLFVSGVATFEPGGVTTLGEHKIVEYRYSVPAAKSRYAIRSGKESVVVGYSGSCWFDAATADLVRLTVQVNDAPADAKACVILTTVDFQRIRTSNGSLPVPSQMTTEVVTQRGDKTVNQVVYSRYRPAEPPLIPQPASPGPALPAGVLLPLELVSAIDSESTFAGDPIEATVTGDIRDRDSHILVAKGTRVRGRIVHLLYRETGGSSTQLVLNFDRMERDGRWVPVKLAPWGTQRAGAGEALFVYWGTRHLSLQPGMKMTWETQ